MYRYVHICKMLFDQDQEQGSFIYRIWLCLVSDLALGFCIRVGTRGIPQGIPRPPGDPPEIGGGSPGKPGGSPAFIKIFNVIFQIFTDFWPNFRRFSFKFMPKFQIFSNFWPNLRKNSNLFHFLGSFLLITMVQN